MRAPFAFLLVLPVLGCGDDTTPTGGSSGAGAGGAGGGGGAAACVDVPAVDPPTDLCERLPGGPAGGAAIPVDLSAAHAMVRFFGPVEGVDAADQALVSGLSGSALTNGDLSAYASALPGVVCARAASSMTLGPASVELVGSTAWIHPGTGDVTLPAEADAVFLDLRGLPDVPELEAALERALGPAISTPAAWPSARVREHEGLTDEVFSASNVYQQRVVSVEGATIAAVGARDLPIALLVDAAPAPAAASLAIALRRARRAFLVGEDVRTDAAESTWVGVGDHGVYVRTRILSEGATPLPDVIPADRRSLAPECVAAEVLAAAAPSPLGDGAADRSVIEKLATFGVIQPAGTSLEEAQAALLVAHGAARRFFPYFGTVGDGIDARLVETLDGLAEPLDRAGFRNALRRFGEVLHDGHSFVFDEAGVLPAGYLPVMTEDVAGELVVRRSNALGVNPGDTIVAIDGAPVVDLMAVEMARSSAASPGYRFDIASRELLRLAGPVSLDLRDADGVTRSLSFTPQPAGDFASLGFAASKRPAGFLGDLGAPTLYYINLDGDVLSSNVGFSAAIAQASTATGLIVDMRGYPGLDIYSAASRLTTAAFSSPIFRVPVLTGPESAAIDESSIPLASQSPFNGPIVLLVGHHSVSAAENFATMLVDAGAVTVLGRDSAATNGNITGVELPGGFGFSFTGMEVLHADARHSVFHGVGIRPAQETPLAASDFRDGLDPELMEAVAALSN